MFPKNQFLSRVKLVHLNVDLGVHLEVTVIVITMILVTLTVRKYFYLFF